MATPPHCQRVPEIVANNLPDQRIPWARALEAKASEEKKE